MKISFTTDNLYSTRTQIQLVSLIEHGVSPDFILLHHSGFVNSAIMRYENYSKIFRNYRLYAVREILNQKLSKKKKNTIINEDFPKYFNTERKKNVSEFLSQVKIYPCRKINQKSTITLLRKFSPDIVICNSGLVGSKVIGTGISFLNIHTSKLPEYRGMNNIEWALWHNDPIYCTIHRIARGIDEGDILYQEQISHEDDWEFLKNIEACREYYFQQSYALIGKAVKEYVDGNVKFVPQAHTQEPLRQYYVMHPILKDFLQGNIKNQKITNH